MGQSRKSYTTENEIEYIHGLGTWSNWAKTYEITHKELVKRYIENNHLKSEWGKVDSKRVMEVAHQEIRES